MKFPEGPISTPNSHLERKNEILETLQRQVLIIKGLLEKQQTLAQSDIETLIPLIDKERDEAISQFDEATIEQYKVYKKFLKEFFAIADTLSMFDYENASEEEISEFENKGQLQVLLYEKIDHLCTSEVSFIEHIEDFFVRLKEVALRTAETRRKKQSPNDVSPFLDDDGTLCGYFLPDAVVRLEEDAFSTTFIINKDSWVKRKNENIRGTYLSNTDIIFIQDGFNDKETAYTLRHERMHHMLDGISRYKIMEPSKMVKRKLERIIRLKILNAPNSLIEEEVKNLLGHNFARRMIDSTQNEFLAAYEYVKDKEFGRNSEAELLQSIFGVDKNTNQKKLRRFNDICRTLRTAGGHILDGHEALNLVAKTLQDKGLDQYVEEAKKQVFIFEEFFLKMIEQVRQAGDYSKILGEGADLEIKALLILLQPTSYHHISTYLKYEYKDAIAIIDANKMFFSQKFINHNSLQRLCNSLKISGSNLSQEQRDQFYKVIKNNLGPEYNDNFLEEACDHPLKAIKLFDEIESVLHQKTNDTSKKGTLAKEYLMEWLIPWRFDSKVFEEIPDNYFSGEDNAYILSEFISGLDFKDEFDNEKKQEVLIFFKRVGLS